MTAWVAAGQGRARQGRGEEESCEMDLYIRRLIDLCSVFKRYKISELIPESCFVM